MFCTLFCQIGVVGEVGEEVEEQGDSHERSLEQELSAWKRSMAYCNPPETLAAGQEGKTWNLVI